MIKVFIRFLLLFLVICPVLAAPCGDVDSNGKINVVDALRTAQYSVGVSSQGFDVAAADVSGDGKITIIDALQIAQFSVGILTSFTGCSSTPTPTPLEPETIFAVNCGGSAYTASDGTRYTADDRFSGGNTYENGKTVSGTSDAALYETERYGNFAYEIMVPNGEFRVTLHFAENYHTTSGSRIFNVEVEGTPIAGNLDLYAEAGSSVAYIIENDVEVNDGQLDIGFTTVTENALVNAIKVTALSYSGEPVIDFTLEPGAILPGEYVTVDASASYDPDGTITNYMIDYGDGYTGTGAITTHQYNTEGAYVITVTITDNDGKSSTLDKTLVVTTDLFDCPETRPSYTPSGSLTQVSRSSWASGVPSEVNMYIYVPGAPSSTPAIVVSCHSCGNSASGQYNNNQRIRQAADKNGFIIIYPDNSQKNCWDVGSTASLTHDGGGDTQAIAQMVQYTLNTYNGDPERVYIMGGSSGAMMTQAMLAVYPNLFKAGSARAGVPAGAWADGYSPSNQWSGNAAGGRTTKTPQQWGDMVRGMYPGYNGPRPRVQLFHGTADATISYNNMGEAIKEWTNVLGLNQTPTSQDTIRTSYNYERQFWKSADCDFVVLEAWSSPGGGHSMSYEEDAILEFFGLEEFRCYDPQVMECSY